MNNNDCQRLQHIQRYCMDVADFIERFGKDYYIFTNDRAYFNAVSMCVLQIGELANGLSQEFREETKEKMQWGMIHGMRNWIAHAYAEMDEEIIWETATNDIPQLLAFCNRILDISRCEKPSVGKILQEATKQTSEDVQEKSKQNAE